MGRRTCPDIVLADSLREHLEATVRRHKASARDVLRARIVLLAADGVATAEIARRLSCDEETVRKWRGRFAHNPSLETLRDRKRTGRPPAVRPETRAHVVRTACIPPPPDLVRTTWSYASISDVVACETGVRLSTSEIGRVLRSQELRPHRVKQWLHSPDPCFAEKVEAVVGLLRAAPTDAVVLSVDEKTGMQALERRYGTRHAAPGRLRREEFEYRRHGTCSLLAAMDVHSSMVLTRCGPTRTADDLVAFMEQIAEVYSDGRVFVVWDNLNIHHDGAAGRWAAFNARHGGRFTFVYTPLHASWVNPIEGWFSILARRVLRHGSFRSVGELTDRVEAFVQRWNEAEAQPFTWTFRGRCEAAHRRAA